MSMAFVFHGYLDSYFSSFCCLFMDILMFH